MVCPQCQTTFPGVPALKVHMAICLQVPPPPSHPGTSAPHFQQGKLGITGLKVRLFLSRVADPHPFYADPGPAFHFKPQPSLEYASS